MLQIQTPIANQVYQRNAQGKAYMAVKGSCSTDVTGLEIICTPGKSGTATSQFVPVQNGVVLADVLLSQGDYSVAYSAVTAAGKDVSSTITRNVGVGEVIVVWGHSVMQGDDRYHLGGATDSRVYCVGIDMRPGGKDEKYNSTGSLDDLPTAIVPYASDVTPGPYGSSTHFWAKFAEHVTLKYNVPTLLLNAAFGGTNLDIWAKSIKGFPFEHGFVNWRIGMPYANLKNAFLKYTSVSGFRCMLVDHGVNDRDNPDYDAVFASYKFIIETARVDANAPAASVVVCRSTPQGKPGIRTMQERVISQVANCVAGPDYDTLLMAGDTIDGVHLSEAGQAKAAKAWADVLAPETLSKMVPYQPKPVLLVTAPVETGKVDGEPLTQSALDKLKALRLAAATVNRSLLLGAFMAAVLILGAFMLGRWSVRGQTP